MSDRDLIARLAHALRVQLDGVDLYSELLTEADARALLAEAQPEAVGAPTDQDLILLSDDFTSYGDDCRCLFDEDAVEFARAVLARWGRPAPEPVSVDGDPKRPAQLAADIRTACESTWVHNPVVAALLELASIMERQRILSADVRAIATELSRYP